MSAPTSYRAATGNDANESITVCWDIDGTLVAKSPARFDLYLYAISAVVGYQVENIHVPHQGMTDLQIIRLYLATLGLSESIAPLVVRWLDNRSPDIYREAGITHSALPGALEALRAVYQAGHRSVLLTGNSEIRARMKLDEARIPTSFFDWSDSGFGHIHFTRVDLARSVARRISGSGLVVGDTPADEECAREAGFGFLGVASGGFTPEALTANGGRAVPDLVSGLPTLLSSLNVQ